MWSTIAPSYFSLEYPMPRQSISFTAPNEAWLKEQVDNEEYNSKSEVVNDLIRKARENEYIRNKLISAEQGGFSNLTITFQPFSIIFDSSPSNHYRIQSPSFAQCNR